MGGLGPWEGGALRGQVQWGSVGCEGSHAEGRELVGPGGAHWYDEGLGFKHL